ncbi:MAG TPA: phosphoribosyl-AMP cyclohydrolase [Gammaproteobacteria bacterium]|nr:phosphoribosyl-AMP cyclohydrolase [Gammaproteobacteria bacterium]
MSPTDTIFRQLETGNPDFSVGLQQVLAQLKWTNDGLIPAVAQQYDTGEVLMLAWMNAESLRETLQTGQVCYWSRSRKSYWRKGESSGHVQRLIGMRIDCDGDSLLLLVDQAGPACHTNRRSCFYNAVDGDRVKIISAPEKD